MRRRHQGRADRGNVDGSSRCSDPPRLPKHGEPYVKVSATMSAQQSVGLEAAGREEHAGLVARAALTLTAWAERWLPDAFIFALVATVLVVLGAMGATRALAAPVSAA